MNKPEQKTTHWHILGAGAIGCLWAAYWQQGNTSTTLIARLAHNPQRLQLEHQQHSFKFTKCCSCAQQLSQPIRHLLLTTKAQHSIDALQSIQHLLSDDAVIITLQNGITSTQTHLRGRQRLYAASTTDGAYFKDSKTLVHVGPGITYLGLIASANSTTSQSEPPQSNSHFNHNADTGPLTQEKQDLAQLRKLLPLQLNIEPCDDIEQRLWRKLAINCAINALAVKYQCSNGELLTSEERRQELKALCLEINQISQALKLGPWFNHLYEEVVKVAKLTHSNINSTLQDINNGKSTEIDELNGYLCREAERLNIATPLNQTLYQLVKQLEPKP